MRIAYVIADRGIPVYGNKGASIHVREMVNAFNAVGCQVTLIVARIGLQNSDLNADIVKVKTDYGNTNLYLVEGDEKRRVRERQSLQRSDSIKTRLMELHRETPFDFIYERYCLFSTAGVRAAHALGIPSIVEVNSPLLLEQQRYRKLELCDEAQAVEAEVFADADAVVTVSEEVCHYVESKGARVARTHVIENGVDTTRFHPNVELPPTSVENERFTLGFVGSLKPWHGIDVLLQAFCGVARENKYAHLLIAGDGPLRQWIDGFVNGAGIEERVTMTGWVPYHQLPGLIQSMSVALAPYPALDHFYFSPLKLYEYMAMGKPVIASDIGQIKQIINDEVNGLLVKPGDVSALAGRIAYLAYDLSLCQTLGARARESILSRTWINNAQRVLSIISPRLRAA